MEEYQAKLAEQAAAVKAEQAAAAAVEGAELEGVDADEDGVFDVAAVTDALEEAVGEADTEVRTTAKSQIAKADEITEESVAFAREGLERDVTVAQKQVDILKEKDAAVVNLLQKIVAYNNVAEEINETATDYAAEAAKFEIANKLEDDAVALDNADDAKAFQVSVDLGDAGTVLLNVVNGKVVVTGLTTEGATDVAEAQGELADAQGELADAQDALIDAKADAAAAQKWVNDLSDANGDALVIADADGAAALSVKLAAVTDAETKLFAVKTALATVEDEDYTTVNSAIVTAHTAKKTVVDSADVPTKETAVTTAKDKEAVEQGKVTAAEKVLADAQKAGASEEAVKAFNELKGVDALKVQIEALYGNIAKEAAAEKAIGAAALKALQDAGYQVFNGADKAVAWSNVKVEDGKIVSAKEGKTFTVQLADKDGKPTGADLVGQELFKTGTINGKGELGTAAGSDDFATLGNGQPESINDAATDSAAAVKALDDAQKAVKAFDDAVETYNALKALQAELTEATEAVAATDKAVADAEAAFEELGVVLVIAEEGVAKGDVFDEDNEDQLDDLFVFSETLTKVEAFDGNDEFYFGTDKDFTLEVVDSAKDIKDKADASAFEIFAVQEGANTVLYVEKEAFAGSSSVAAADNSDLVKITLTGVNVDSLQFEDGFLTLA